MHAKQSKNKRQVFKPTTKEYTKQREFNKHNVPMTRENPTQGSTKHGYV